MRSLFHRARHKSRDNCFENRAYLASAVHAAKIFPRPNDRNISQHCWVQHVACVWPHCCDVLRHVGSNLTIFKLEPTTPNMSQHVATGWPNARNMLRPTLLRYVAMACCDRLARALTSRQTNSQLTTILVRNFACCVHKMTDKTV